MQTRVIKEEKGARKNKQASVDCECVEDRREVPVVDDACGQYGDLCHYGRTNVHMWYPKNRKRSNFRTRENNCIDLLRTCSLAWCRMPKFSYRIAG